MRMVLLAYSAAYGVMNVYLLSVVYRAFPEIPDFFICLSAFCMLMVVAPLLSRFFDRLGCFRSARVVSLVGQPWMAITMWFCSLAIVTESWNLIVRIAAAFQPGALALTLKPKPALAVFTVLISIAVVWSIREASIIHLRRLAFRTPHLPAGATTIRLLQISDLHLGMTVSERKLKQVIRIISKVRPDVIVSTGDLIDASIEYLMPLADMLAEVKPPFGKFAVLGNHEYYAGLDNSLAFLKAAGFHVLRGNSILITKNLRLAGVDDSAGKKIGQLCVMDEENALLSASPQETTILLKHRPTILESSIGRFDLQLSGHTHGGQIFSFDKAMGFVYPLRCGFCQLGKGSAAYVSRGTGTWGPPMRLMSPPEVTLVTIKPLRISAPAQTLDPSKQQLASSLSH